MKTLSVPNEILIPEIKRALDGGHTATFRVRGFSMRPFLEDLRDKVMLAPAENELRIGDVVLAEDRPRHYVLHRIVGREGHRLTLRGDGNLRGTETCSTEDVIGIVTAFYRKGRSVPDTTAGIKWRCYSRIWLALTPLRRWLLAFYRRIWLKIFPVKIQ